MGLEEKKEEGLDPRYLAGFFDGEGCVRISTDARRRSYYIHVQVSNKNEAVIYAHKDMFGGAVSRITQKSEKRSGYFVWHVVCGEAKRYLETIFPYIRTKKKQVELALRFHERALSEKHPGWRGRPESEIAWREAEKKEISRLKTEDVGESLDYAESLPYVAGLVDGEGCVQIYKANERYLLTLTVGNTDKKMIDSLKGKFGGSITALKLKSPKHHQAWHWVLHGDAAANLLGQLLPDMIVKKEQAVLACEFQSCRRSGNKECHERIGQIYKSRISALNQRKFTA